MMLLLGTCLSLLSTLAPLPAASPEREQPAPEVLETYLSELHTLGYWSGVALVKLHDQDLFRGARGEFDRGKSPERPTGIDDEFRIGSITKLFTQVALLRLMEQGDVDLDTTIGTYRPAMNPDLGRAVTLRHLLTFRSGLPSELGEGVRGVEFDADGLAGPFLDGQEVELGFEPGTRTSYSNLGYWYLGAVIEAVTGTSYQDAVQALVLDPLGLEHTTFATTVPGTGQACNGHEGAPGGRLLPVEPYDVRGRFASGMMSSTLADLEALCLAVREEGFLGAAGRTELFRAFRLDKKEVTKEGGPVMKAAGFVPGWRSYLRYHPREGHLVILLNNRSIFPPQAISRIGIDCVNVMRGEAPRPIPMNPAAVLLKPWKDGHPGTELLEAGQRLAEIIGSGDEAALLAWHREHRPGLRTSEATSLSEELLGLPGALGGWDLNQYAAPHTGMVILGVSGDSGDLQLITLEAESLAPLRIGGMSLARRSQ